MFDLKETEEGRQEKDEVNQGHYQANDGARKKYG